MHDELRHKAKKINEIQIAKADRIRISGPAKTPMCDVAADVQTEDTRSLPPPSRTQIECSVAQVFGVSDLELRQANRGRAKVALARQVAMYLAHVTCGLTLTAVGRLFSRDRTTVAHACSLVEDRRDDPSFDHALELLERVIQVLGTPRRAPSEFLH